MALAWFGPMLVKTLLTLLAISCLSVIVLLLSTKYDGRVVDFTDLDIN